MRNLSDATRWGDSDSPEVVLTPAFKMFLFSQLGMDPQTSKKEFPPNDFIPSLEPSPRLPTEFQTKLEKMLLSEQISTDIWMRTLNSVGRGYLDLLRSRLGKLPAVVELVVYPRTHDDVVNIICLANEYTIPVSTVAGRTTVTLGIQASQGVIALNLCQMNKLVSVIKDSHYVVVQPGIMGPELEKLLNHQNLTIGHFPQSFEFSTVGGWVATRGAGQNSTLYGKIEDMVMGLKVVTGRGRTIIIKPAPARAIGPDLNHLFTGSEGSLGIITEITLRVAEYPQSRKFSSFFFRSFEEGLRAFRDLLQKGYRPAILRLSDVSETFFNLRASVLLSDPPKNESFFVRLLLNLLERWGYHENNRCLGIMVFEGDSDSVNLTQKTAISTAKKYGGFHLRGMPARRWYNTRFESPYLRDSFVDYGILLDTYETSTTWDKIIDLYKAILVVLKSDCPMIWTHGSHFYANGANLYFTVLAPQETGNEIEQFTRIRQNIVQTIQAQGASLSHHHGIGRLFVDWFPQELGFEGIELLSAIKKHTDPNYILNPGIFGLPKDY